MSEAIGMIVGAQETVQDASKLGNALKTIAVNIGGVTYNAKEGEVTLNKTAKALKEVAGIETADLAKGTTRPLFDVLNELHDKWDSLNDVEQKTVTEAIGSKYHANVLQAMLDNWETVLQYVQEYNDGFTVDSAKQENARYIDSLEGKIVALKDQFRDFITTVISSDMTKGLVTGFAEVMEMVNKVTKSLDSMGMALPATIGTVASLFRTLKASAKGEQVTLFGSSFYNDLKKAQTQTKVVTNQLKDSSGTVTSMISKNSNKLASNIQTSNMRIQKSLGNSNKQFKVYRKDATGNLKQISNTYSSATIVAEQTQKGLGKTAGSMVLAGAKSMAASVGISLLNGAMITLASTLIGNVIGAIDSYVHRTEDMYQNTKENIDKTQKEIGNLNTKKSNLKSMADDFEELSSKMNLTSEEAEKLSQYKQQLAEMFPELVTGYDENGDPLLALSGSADDLIEKLDIAIKKKQELLRLEEKDAANEASKMVGKYRQNQKGNIEDNIKQNALTNPFFDYSIFSNGLADYEKGCKRYEQIAQRTADKINSINNSNIEKSSEYYSLEQAQQKDAMNEMNRNARQYKNYANLGDTQKGKLIELMGIYDWSNELVAENINKRNEFLAGFDKVADYAVDNYDKVEEWNKTLNAANDVFQATGNIDDYKKSISGVAEELEKLTGIDSSEWIESFVPQLQGKLDKNMIELNGFLKGFGKNLMDVNLGDDAALQLQKQFDDLKEVADELAGSDIPIETKIDLVTKIGKNDDPFVDLPPQIRNLIQGITDGGDKVTTTELEVITAISTSFKNTGGIADDENLKLINKMLNGELTEAECQVGISLKDGNKISPEITTAINNAQKDKDNQIKVDLDKDYLKEQLENIKSEIKKYTKVSENEKISDLFTSGTIDTSQLEYVNKLLESMPFGDKTVDLICELGGAFNNGELTNYKSIIEYLLDHPKVANKVGVTVVGEKTVDTVKNELDKFMETDEEKKIAVRVENGLAKGDIASVEEALSELDEEKRIKVVSDIIDALDGLDTVDARTIKEKLVKFFIEKDEVDEKTSEIEGKPAQKSVVFKSENFAETLGQTIELDEKGNPVIKPLKFTTEGFSTTVQQTDTVSSKSKPENKAVTISTNGYTITVQQEDTVSNKAKPETKKVTMDGKNGFTDTVNKEDTVTKKAKDETKKVTFIGAMSDGLKGIFAKIDKFIAGASIPVRFGSVEGFKNISDTPVEINAPTPPVTAQSDVSMSSIDGAPPTPTEGTDGVSATAFKDFGAVGSSKSTKTKIDITSKNLLYALKNGINMFQELENRISRCTNQLALLDKKMERATGTEKIKNLKKQNELYEQQVGLQKEYYDSLMDEKKILREQLKKKGFTFNNQGNLTSYEEKLAKMQKEYDRLEKAYDKAQKSENDYKGKSDKKKKSYSKATEKAKDKLDKYKEKLDETKDLTEEYIKIQYTDLPKAEQEWQDMKNSIEENKDAIEKLLLEDRLYKFKNGVTELSNEFKVLGNQLDLLDAKLEYATGKEKVDLYGQEIKQIEKQRVNLQKTIDQYNEMVDAYKDSLSSYGFKFDENNNVTNQKEILDKYQNTDDLEKVTDLLEEYIKLQTDELPDAIVQWEELGNKIKDIQKEKLDIAKDMEEEITKVYEDEIDKRKDAIEKEKDARVKALEDQKKAYQDYRSEVDYKDDYNEQLDKVNKLKNKISILERDTSLASRSKLQEAYDELAEEEKALKGIQQDRLDEKIEDMYDKEIDKAEKESEDKIKALENLWTPEKIAEMVTKNLSTNTFTDLDGNVKNLQDTLIEFAETSGDALGIMGDSIKNDLINNLQIATDVLKQYTDIYNSLGLKQYGTNYKDMYEGSKSNNTNLQLGGIHINIQGNPDEVTIDKLTKAIEEEFKYISNKL
jgi:hypothetical protein